MIAECRLPDESDGRTVGVKTIAKTTLWLLCMGLFSLFLFYAPQMIAPYQPRPR
jgi:hypothetical protein